MAGGAVAVSSELEFLRLALSQAMPASKTTASTSQSVLFIVAFFWKRVVHFLP
jgi:hypothetical protein